MTRRSRASLHLAPGFAGERSRRFAAGEGGEASRAGSLTPSPQPSPPQSRGRGSKTPRFARFDRGDRTRRPRFLSFPHVSRRLAPAALDRPIWRGAGAGAAGARPAIPLPRRPVVRPVPRGQLPAARPDEAAHVPRSAHHRGLPVLVRVQLHGHRVGGRDRAVARFVGRGRLGGPRGTPRGRRWCSRCSSAASGRSRALWGCRT